MKEVNTKLAVLAALSDRKVRTWSLNFLILSSWNIGRMRILFVPPSELHGLGDCIIILIFKWMFITQITVRCPVFHLMCSLLFYVSIIEKFVYNVPRYNLCRWPFQKFLGYWFGNYVYLFFYFLINLLFNADFKNAICFWLSHLEFEV